MQRIIIKPKNYKPTPQPQTQTPQAHTHTEGGLGDIIHQYLESGPIKYFKHLKENGYEPQIINHDYTHNPSSYSIHEHNPHYTNIPQTFTHQATTHFNNLPIPKLQNLIDLTTIPHEQPEFYLTHEENKWIETIPKPYITLQPYAGTPERNLPINLTQLIKDLTKHAPLILLGGSGPRTDGNNGQTTRTMHEYYTTHHENLYNTMNRWTPRVQCQLVKHTHTHIGTMSAYILAALYTPTPKHILHCIPQHTLEHMHTKNRNDGYWGKLRYEAQTYCTETQNFQENITQQIINTLKNKPQT